MTEQPKRSQRARKPPSYLHPEILSSDPFGFVNPNNIKDCVSPAVEMNSNAKLLVAFINELNNSLRRQKMRKEEKDNEKMMDEVQEGRKTLPKVINKGEEKKKILNLRKDRPETIHPKQKQLYSFKDQSDNPQMVQSLIKNTHLQKPKGKPLPFPNILLQTNHYPSSNFSQPIQINHLPQTIYQMQDQKMMRQTNGLGSKQEKEKNKLFGRSAYHIAIAYHIYLEGMKKDKEKVGNLLSLDPTYHSKMLKESSQRQI